MKKGEIKSDQQEIKDVKKNKKTQLISSYPVLCVYFLRPACLNVSYQKDCRWIFPERWRRRVGKGMEGRGVFGVQPQGTLRDEETCVPAWNNKIHQVFIKLSGEGRISDCKTSAAFAPFLMSRGAALW